MLGESTACAACVSKTRRSVCRDRPGSVQWFGMPARGCTTPCRLLPDTGSMSVLHSSITSLALRLNYCHLTQGQLTSTAVQSCMKPGVLQLRGLLASSVTKEFQRRRCKQLAAGIACFHEASEAGCAVDQAGMFLNACCMCNRHSGALAVSEDRSVPTGAGHRRIHTCFGRRRHCITGACLLALSSMLSQTLRRKIVN